MKKTLCIAVSAALLMGTATLASAADTMSNMKNSTENAVDSTIDKLPPKRTMTRAEYSSEKDSIEAGYKSAKTNCASMTGNAKSVCHVEAKSDETTKLADLEAQYKGTPSADKDARVAKAKAQYDVAKQKCDDLTGSDKSTCKSTAKADEDRAIADAKAAAKTASSN
jgi:opacity protein-like surface antigen